MERARTAGAKRGGHSFRAQIGLIALLGVLAGPALAKPVAPPLKPPALKGKSEAPAAIAPPAIASPAAPGAPEAPDAALRKRARIASAENNAKALMALSEIALRSQEGFVPSDARPMLERAAKLGLADAAALLGELHLGGAFGAPDEAQAARWYETAAERGHLEAAYSLGVLLAEKDSPSKEDLTRAARYFKFAADKNHPAALAAYGLMIAKGQAGVPVGPGALKAAFPLFQKAAEAGDSEGMFLLAIAYAKGEGVARNLILALKWAQDAAAAPGAEQDPDRAKLVAALKAAIAKEEAKAKPG